jgi:copper transport protein
MRRLAATALAVLAALALVPAAASAHAYLIRTVPAASVVLSSSPATVQLTYDEAVEPRFALVSVTDVAGHQQTTGRPTRSPGDPDTLAVPVRRLPEGWYLVYWRAISVDGHPVQGAFTYAVGPDPGPAPQFVVPDIATTAAAPQLLVARWVMFVAVMAAIGLLALRLFVVRGLARRLPEVSLRPVSIAFLVAAVVGLVATPVYLDLSVANDSLRSVLDVSALAPLYGVTAFGRGMLDLELLFALFCAAGAAALWLDRPERGPRSVAALAATTGTVLAAAAVVLVPGTAGHAAQTSPRGLTLGFDAVHLLAGSIWLGGLLGLLILAATAGQGRRVATLAAVVPRFSAVAFLAVLVLAGTGLGEALDHLPSVSALTGTGYGQAILVKTGLLGAAVLLASGNLLRARPRLSAAAARPELGEPAGRLLRRLASGEVVLVLGVVFAAAVLSSLAPPPPAFALSDRAVANVGPGTVVHTVQREGYTVQFAVAPNRAAAPNTFSVRLTRAGRPVSGATVTVTFNHTEMEMPQQEYALAEKGPGVYSRAAPALVMVGRWALDFQVTPPGAPPFSALVLDQANG